MTNSEDFTVLTDEEEQRIGRNWIPVDMSHDPDYAGRSRVQNNLGLIQEWREHPAHAFLTGSGTGLAGATSVCVAVAKQRD